MTTAKIWRLTAQELVKKTICGDITAESAIKASIDRMQKINPVLNAVVMDLSELALERARQLDIDKARGKKLGPLHGLPVTIKINVDQANCPTSNGVTALKNDIAKADSPVVRNLQNAGAIVIGRTNTPEFSFRAETDNPIHGRTHNPWGEHVSVGGSSGGAAAALLVVFGGAVLLLAVVPTPLLSSQLLPFHSVPFHFVLSGSVLFWFLLFCSF